MSSGGSLLAKRYMYSERKKMLSKGRQIVIVIMTTSNDFLVFSGWSLHNLHVVAIGLSLFYTKKLHIKKSHTSV